MQRKILIGIAIFISIMGFLAYQAYQFTEFLEDLDGCGMAVGPIYGDSISVNTEDLTLEQQIEIPGGKLGLMNLSDSLAPKLIRFDESDRVIWAVEFGEDSLAGIPHKILSEMNLEKDSSGYLLSFFNHSFSEPGKIYLTKDYDLEYMCLSPF